MDAKEVLKEQEPMTLAVVMLPIIEQLGKDKKFPAVHTYGCTLRSFQKYAEQEEIFIQEIFQPGTLKEYETWLRGKRASWNTVSTYMRTLRATYNRLVRMGLVTNNPQLFSDVRTKVESLTKRALTEAQMQTLLSADINLLPKEVQPSFASFSLTFLLRGMPFIDLAYLQKGDLKGNCITYCRHKTGRQMVVRVPVEAQKLLNKFRNKNQKSIYLFPILDGEIERDEKASETPNEAQLYTYYLRSLHRFNKQLVKVTDLLLPNVKLTSYTPRHTWATLAFHKGISVGIISRALGHSSIKVTETYLKPFENEKIDAVNEEFINSVVTKRTFEPMTWQKAGLGIL